MGGGGKGGRTVNSSLMSKVICVLWLYIILYIEVAGNKGTYKLSPEIEIPQPNEKWFLENYWTGRMFRPQYQELISNDCYPVAITAIKVNNVLQAADAVLQSFHF